MPSWDEIVLAVGARPPEEANAYIRGELTTALGTVGELRGGRNVLFYGSAFLQKPQVPQAFVQLTYEEINGLMAVIHGMQWDAGLTLVLHTPGGVINAAETFVDYLRSKFDRMEVIVPTFAMSAGTMISLAADRIIMARHSQLGPIDAQLPTGQRFVSAGAVVTQFDKAKEEILADERTAHVWAPVLQSLGPGLLEEARNALGYGEEMVARWLENYMFSGLTTAGDDARRVAHHFSDTSTHKSHGRRIGREEARTQGVVIDDLEASQDLQEAVLTAYHLMTIIFEKSPAAKVMASAGNLWVKNIPQISA